MNDTLTAFAQAKIDELEARSLRRVLNPTHRVEGPWVERQGRRLLSFSCNDYLNLSHHPEVKAAAIEAIETYGAGAGASRLVTGDHPLFSALEARLAQLKGAEAACIFGSGYLANAGIIPTLVGPEDLILADDLAHSSIWTGCRLSGATVVGFRHNDASDLALRLTRHRGRARRALVVTEGVFSMDGDIAPLDEISRHCQALDAWLLVDDAHGLGVLGDDGAGVMRLFPGARVDLAMGTLSKALGGYGAYVCAAAPVIDLIKTRARTVIYSTGLPPASVAAAIAALRVIAHEPERVAIPLRKAQRFTAALGLAAAQSPIVPVMLGAAQTALSAAEDLSRQGFLAVAIRPPTVPAGTSRLRLAFTAAHSDRDIERLAEAVRPWLIR